MSRIEHMNREGIRRTVWGIADHKPKNSAEAVRNINNFINLSLYEVAKDLPFLFDEQIIHTPVYADITPTIATDTLETTVDPWVLRMTLSNAVVGTTPWEADVDWDGRQIHLKHATDAQWRLMTIREAWTNGTIRYLTLTQAYEFTPSAPVKTGIDWKIYAHVLRLPSDVIQVKAAHLLRDGISYPLGFQNQGDVEQSSYLRPSQYVSTGPPNKLFRRPMLHMDAPAFKPVPVVNEGGVWVAERPVGQFEYCFTYAWGRGEEWDNTGGPLTNTILAGRTDRNVPWLESPPSAVSDPVTVISGDIRFDLPDIERMLGFDSSGTLRFLHSGLRKRIYVRRLTDGGATPSVEVRERFYFLTEITAGNTFYIDNGSVLPDLNSPLRDNHGFQQLELRPSPDQRYDIQMRVVLAPRRMETDTDSPHIPEVALQALLYRVLSYLYESTGNFAAKRDAMADYNTALQDIRKRYGRGTPNNVPGTRRPASVRRRGRTRKETFSTDPFSDPPP